MKKIISYLREYVTSLNKPLFFFATLFTGIAVFANYRYGINGHINRLSEPFSFVCWYGLFLFVFAYGYLLQVIFLKSRIFHHKKFIALLLLAPAVFAWKMSAHIQFDFVTDLFEDEYWNAVVYWPFKVIVITAMLLFIYRAFDKGQPFYGATLRGFAPKPYLIMLLVMIPLVAVASTQKDFLATYPRFQSIAYLLQPERGPHKLLYELSYGTDFFSIELFFRGFLVLAFARWAGKEAILPMAIFYCTIHFGKPLGECISSYFGGLILGVISYQHPHHPRWLFGARGHCLADGAWWISGAYFLVILKRNPRSKRRYLFLSVLQYKLLLRTGGLPIHWAFLPPTGGLL